MSKIISLNIDAEGIAELRWDDPDRKVNVFTPKAIDEFAGYVAQIASETDIRGVLITSAKKVFHAGADLNMVSDFFDMSAQDLWVIMFGVMQNLYTLETCGKPVAAVIEGHCLGGGFEMALAAHARFVADDPAIKIGLPEAGLGLMPGFGGTQRMTRLAPWQQATYDILKGTSFNPQTALSLNLANRVMPRGAVEQAARDWLLENPAAEQPWMARGYKAVGSTQGFERFFQGLNAGLSRDGAVDRPESKLIAEAIYHGLQLPIEPALRLEVRRFIELTRNATVKETLRARFFGKTV